MSVWRRLSYGQTLAAITAAATILRFALLARQPLGIDEDFTAVVVHASPGRMLEIVAHDSAPPLFYLAEKLVVAISTVVAPGPEWAAAWLRVVPAIAGVALIPLLAALGRRIGGDRAGLWTAAFVAFAPTTVVLAGFARMYGLGAAFTVAAALLLWRAVEQPGPGRWLMYAGAAVAATWIDYFCIVALAGILVAAMWLRPGLRVAATAFGVTALAVATILPWLLIARSQFDHAGQSFWIPPLGPTMVGGTLAQLFMGPEAIGSYPFGAALIGLQVLAVGAGCVALAVGIIAWRRSGEESRRAAVYCALAASGVLMLAAVSIWRPILDARYAGVMWLPVFAICGLGLAAMPRRAAALVVVAVAVPSLALGVVTTHPETSSLVPVVDAAIAADLGGHDLVDVALDHYLVFLDEGGPQVQARLHVLTPANPQWYLGTAAYPPDAVIHAVPSDLVANGGRIFWIGDPGDDPVLLPAGYRAVQQECVIGVCLTTYAPR